MDADKASESVILEGVGRSQSRILDNLGITISFESCPNYLVYIFCRDAYYGTGFMSMVWCQHVRPFLCRKKQEVISNAFNQAQLQQQKELLDVVIEKGKENAC